METVTLTIDGREFTVEKGKTVLQAAIENGIQIPFYCYHPALGVDGSCRVCIVRVEKMPKLQTSCSTICTDGMVVHTSTPEVIEARASVFEFLLINHPLDCPVCDKGGECPLQDYSYTFGRDASRMDFPRRVFDGEGVKGDVDFGPTLMLNRQRCILCTRCIRFMRDVDGDAQISVQDRGYGSQLETFQEEGVHSILSGNLMDVCPVGALTTKDYRFKSRPWDNPTAVDSICTLCAKGCATTVWLRAKPEWAKGPRLARITPRFNPEVNDFWMCDIGRFDYHFAEGDDRVRKPLVRKEAGLQQPTSWHDVLVKLREALGADQRDQPRGYPLPRLRARVDRGTRPPRPDYAGVAGRRRRAEDCDQLEGDRQAPARSDQVQGAARGRAQREGRSGSRPGRRRGPDGAADLATLRAEIEAGQVSAVYVLDPGPAGSIGDVSWLIEARQSGRDQGPRG